MSIVPFVILVLANWRLASLLSREGGPWDFLFAIRHRLGVRYDERNTAYGQNVISRGLICIWCNSVWIGLIQAACYFFVPDATLLVFLPFALSSGAIVMERGLTGE
jgi:hypothetical protein